MLCRLCFAIIVLCLASPSDLAANHHHHHSRITHVSSLFLSLSYSRAHVERLKLIRVYERRVKPGAECRGEIATCAWPMLAGSVSKFIPRGIVSFDFLVVPEGRCVDLLARKVVRSLSLSLSLSVDAAMTQLTLSLWWLGVKQPR